MDIEEFIDFDQNKNFFLSKNAKKRAGLINLNLELDDAFILMRYFDKRASEIDNNSSKLNDRLFNILNELSEELHSEIMLKTKSFLYKKEGDFIDDIDDAAEKIRKRLEE